MGKLIKYLNIIRKDNYEKKPFIQIFFEILHCMIIYKEFPHFYIHKMLYRKGNGNYLNYLSHHEWKLLIRSGFLHNPSFTDFFKNKLLFDRVFTEAQIRIPVTLSYKIGDYIYFTKESKGYYFTDNSEFAKILYDNIFHHYERAFVKTMDTMGGANCYLITKDNIPEISKLLLMHPTLLIQEVIEQHEQILNINPNSINTIRFDTFRRENGEIIILNTLMRIGVGNSIVDNASSGGFFVKVNSETGVLNNVGRQFLRFGGNIYNSHPDTGFIFDGFKIPYFNESKELIKLAMNTINERLVGWDIAITQDGPLIMEGNHSLSLFMSDIAIEGYKQNEEMRMILKKIR